MPFFGYALIFVCRSSAVIVFTFLNMFETHMFENFLWESSAILQVYTNSFLKNQLVYRYFWSIHFKVRVSQNLFCRRPLSYGGPEVQLFSANHNYLLQITTTFYKPKLFQYCNFFLQSTTFLSMLRLFSTNHDFIHQATTFFYLSQLFFPNIAAFFYNSQLFSITFQFFSTNHNFFLQTTTFFRNIATFLSKSHLFSTNHNLFL